MTQEEKELLLKDLCARLPYGVMCKASIPDLKTDTPPKKAVLRLTSGMLNYIWIDCRSLRSYLRPIYSMTEEEREQYNEYLFYGTSIGLMSNTESAYELLDWLNSHHFDYRGLINKGLALKASEGMYK